MVNSPDVTPSMGASHASGVSPSVSAGDWSAEPRPALAEIDVFGITDPGRVRRENQDPFLIVSLHKLPPGAVSLAIAHRKLRSTHTWLGFELRGEPLH